MTLIRRTRRHLTPRSNVSASFASWLHPMAVLHKRISISMLSATLLLTASLYISGCTIGAVPSTPTLANTTSAEQSQRIFWQDVKQQKWQAVQALLVANTTWRNGKDVLTRDEVVPYLQKQQVKDFLITNLVVKANQDDMTVLYDLQLTTAASPAPVNFHVVSVWQEVPPPPDSASKQAKKQAKNAGPYLLIVEDLVPDTATQ